MQINRNTLDSYFYENGDNVTYYDSFGVEHVPKETKEVIGKKNITKIFIEYKQMIQ